MHALNAETPGTAGLNPTLASMDDRSVLKLYTRTRDPDAFAVLAARYQRMVLATCKRALGNDADAQDAAQETFLTLAREAGKIKTNAAAWLHTCAVRTSVDLIRRSGAQRRAETRAASGAVEQALTDEAVLWREVEPLLDDALAQLSEDDRGLLVARYLSGRSQAEIARDLGVPDGTVSRRTKKALGRLRGSLESKGLVIAGGVGTGVLASVLAKAGSAALPSSVAASLATSVAKIGLAGVARPEAPLVSVPMVAAAVIGTVAVLGGAYGIANMGSGGSSNAGVVASAPLDAAERARAVRRPRRELGPFEVVGPVYPLFANRGAIIRDDEIFIGRNIDRDAGEVSYVHLAIESTTRDGATTVFGTRILEEVNSPGIIDRYEVGQRVTIAVSVDERGILTIDPLEGDVQFGRNQPQWFGVRPPEGWPESADIPADAGPGGVLGPWAAKEWWPVRITRDEIRFGTDRWQSMKLGVIDWERADGFSRVMTIYRGGWEQRLTGRRFPVLLRETDGVYELAYYPAFRERGLDWPTGFEFSEDNPVHVLRFTGED